MPSATEFLDAPPIEKQKAETFLDGTGGKSAADFLGESPEPGVTPKTLSATLSPVLAQYLEGPGFDKAPDAPSPNKAGQILENAATGLARTAEGFIPHSLTDILGFLTPVVSSAHELKKGYEIGKEILTTPASIEEATRKFSPESFVLADADKTPAFSKERFTAGFGTLSQMLMAGGIVRGLSRAAKPVIAEPVRPATEPVESILSKSPEAAPALTGEAIEQAPMSDVIAPEVASPPSASIPLTFDEYSAAKGVSSTPPSFPEYHRAAGGVSEPSAKAAAQRTADALTEWGAKRDELKAEYDSMLASGELREPTRIEKLQAAAKGQGPAAEAARRLLAKQATVPDLKSTEEAVAHGESGTADVPALNAKRDALLSQAETATGDEKVALITQAQLYREAAQTATKTNEAISGPEGAGTVAKGTTVGETVGTENEPAAPASIKSDVARSDAEPITTGIAQRVHEARANEGRQGEILPGEGVSAEEMVDRGRELLKAGADPEKIIAGVSEGKAVTGDEMATLRARHEELSKITDQAADALRKTPDDPTAKQTYEDAFKAETDFAQRIKPAATEWHKVGQSMQGETDINTGSFTGLRRAFIERTGRDVTKAEAVKLEKTAGEVQKIEAEVEKAKTAFRNVVEKETRTTLPKTADELRSHFAERLKQLLPCEV